MSRLTTVETEDVTALEAPRRILFDMFAYQFEEAHDSLNLNLFVLEPISAFNDLILNTKKCKMMR